MTPPCRGLCKSGGRCVKVRGREKPRHRRSSQREGRKGDQWGTGVKMGSQPASTGGLGFSSLGGREGRSVGEGRESSPATLLHKLHPWPSSASHSMGQSECTATSLRSGCCGVVFNHLGQRVWGNQDG